MPKKIVSITKYEKPYESVKKAVSSCGGFDALRSGARVFIKPNIVFWSSESIFPKWGVITTSRVVEDIVVLLKEHGIDDITIGEGIVDAFQDDGAAAHASAYLGYDLLGEKYGVKFINVMKRPFKKVDLGDGITLSFNQDIMESDFVIDLPVMKSHSQTVVSLGIKNLKGTINTASRKKCHNEDRNKDLHYHVSKLADKMPPILTVIDGIYSLSRGPSFDGRAKRSNLLIASPDILSADMVGAKLLGYHPEEVPHLVWAAKKRGRPLDLSDLEIVGEDLAEVAAEHEYTFDYSITETGEMPMALARSGISGLFYRKFDDTMCTYCSSLTGLVLIAIRQAWSGEPWDNIEVLTGKVMEPAPGMGATILLGQCMYKLNKNHPNINKMVAVKGCPPKPEDVVKALHEVGIEVNPSLFSNIAALPGAYMERYRDRPEFEESFFKVE